MHAFRLFFTQNWFSFLDSYQQTLVREAVELFEREERLHSAYLDYGYLVFPMAKVFEGFTKKFFLELGLISQETYQGKKFRIGRALNPDLFPEHRDRWWLYDDVTRLCSRELAQELWMVWLTCRNQLFHDFQGHHQYVTLNQARKNVMMIAEAMENARRCKWQQTDKRERVQWTNDQYVSM